MVKEMRKMRSILVLVLFVGLSVSTGVADEILTFEEYADDAAWIADARDGFTFDYYYSGNVDFQLVSNPYQDATNSSDKVICLVDNFTGASIMARREFAEEVTAGGEISFKHYDTINNTPLYDINFYSDGAEVVRIRNYVYIPRFDVWTAETGWVQNVASTPINQWHTMSVQLGDGSVTISNDTTSLGTYTLDAGTTIDEIGFGFDDYTQYKINSYIDDLSITVPEPSTLLLLGLGGVLSIIRKRK